MRYYTTGCSEAAASLGLTKLARGYMGPDGVQRPFWASVGAHTKRQLVGQPGAYWDEVMHGRAFAPGTVSRQSFLPDVPAGAGTGTKLLARMTPALTLLPAGLGVYGALTAPPEYRGEALGSALGSGIGTVLGMPLGILGTAGASLGLGALGGSIGRAFDSPTPKTYYHAAGPETPPELQQSNFAGSSP